MLGATLLAVLSSVLAQTRKLEVDYPEAAGLRPEVVTTEFPEYVQYIFGMGVLLLGLIAFTALVWAGIIYLTSAGNPTRQKEGKDRIISALAGIIILLSSYIILNIINPQLVNFDLRPLLAKLREPRPLPPPLESDEITLITKELPLGQAIENGVWEAQRTSRIQSLFERLDGFLKEDLKIPEAGRKIRPIADLNKYLNSLTEECQCGNMDAFATKPEQGGQGIVCTGEPCSDETRRKIKNALNRSKASMEKLLDFKQGIAQEKMGMETALNRLDEIEQDVNSCQSQTGGVYSLSEYTNLAQYYDDIGSQTAILTNHFDSRADPLTFYCPVGGTAFDFPYFTEVDILQKIDDTALPISETEFAFSAMNCPVELPVGQVTDNLRELAILLSIKMSRTMLLIDDLAKKINRVSDLIEQFNGSTCRIETACIPNPCWMACAPIPILNPCAPFCESRCLQVVGSCVGQPGPRINLLDTVEEIKELEDELFLTIEQAKEIFPKAEFALRSPENPINLHNVKTGVGLCSSSYELGEFGPRQDWILLNCENAIGNTGPDGLTIGACQPRSFYCCSATGAVTPTFPPAIQDRPKTIIPQKTYTPLPSKEDNCPIGWECNEDVKRFNQYGDASEPLKELLSCMRERLDKVQKEKEITQTLGRITSISDSKLTIGTCDWGSGPTQPGGCSHVYTIRHGREVVSAHYGGPLCRYQRSSYAVDIGARLPHEKKYVEEIIIAAKECAPNAFIGYMIPGHYDHVHIGIGNVYQCGAN